MLCSEVLLVKPGDTWEDVKPLPCNRWTCPRCGPARRRALQHLAASGEPNKILTITVNPAIGSSAAHRRDILHDSWKRLVKRILRQFALHPAARWHLKSGTRARSMHQMIAGITGKTQAKEVTAIHYMAFLEKTKKGEPHLHILLRCPFIPQDWIAEQMGEMSGSPVCWIEQINGTQHAVQYVTKYVTKEPAQFGNKKRYWKSRNWQINKPERPEKTERDMRDVVVRREKWNELSYAHVRNRGAIDQLEDGWYRLHHPATSTSWERYRWARQAEGP